MYHWRGAAGPVDLAFTDRYGGVGAAPHFAAGDVLVARRQVHGAHVDVVGDPEASVPASGQRTQEADGIVTARPGLALMVRAADCVPVLLADPRAGVIGAVHSGRLGTVAGVAPAAVGRMRAIGAGEITAWIGPHVCGRCYEVPAQMRREVVAVVPAAGATTSWGTPSLDLGAGVRAQLEAAGCRVVDVAACTRESATLFSHRREGAAAGRLAGLVRRRP